MLYITYSLNFLLMIAMPLALGWFLARRYGLAWRLFIVGAVTFVLAQVFHVPFNAGLTLAFRQGLLPSPPEQYQLMFNAVVLGLSAGVFEEMARYLVLKFSLKHARSWSKALMFGAGHGGVEAIIVGVLAAISFGAMILYQSTPEMLAALPAEQAEIAQAQLAAFWSAPWYMTLLGAAERLFAICLHLSLAVMVMQVFLRDQIRWLFFAIGWHALVNAAAVYSLPKIGALATEGILAVAAILSIAIVFALRTPDPSPPDDSIPAAELEPAATP